MAVRRVPDIGTRVNLTMFATDILSHQGHVTVERHLGPQALGDLRSVVFRDGAGVQVSLSGDRSSLRMILTAALSDLGPEAPDPEPAEEAI